ncbi:MAG: aminotransferase class I/II-fold pyridoxal phosphate-dependent enzyme [Rhodospirillales bacterium]|nr:aminotransferase class I/II-fold pyridoxal phosphate-dependent enzyme [Rhodospirillales bacterium]MCW8861272.1 aminotransferase class I/II-fold pyridoxal phosphate-dependent enzyme [Rhodospirillales bacterium]MCW8952828.1 aminotransferase class I/II-fold pyridoxal phosphate-dependent enzyme [Rhodospirillales bacterium]MCW9001114.1 aminotransferase class I/II-fold pyridoxal phosphate-dependent enzyme [Rhodospirillales bacterium]
MTLKAAKRGAIPPFIVMDVMRAANVRADSGKDVFHLEVGQPSTPAPGAVLDAARAALGADRLGYTDALGVPILRERIAAYYADTYGVQVDPSQIVATTGSSGGFVLSFLAAFDAGDRVGVCSPGYPAYRNILRALGNEPVDILVGADTHFQPTPEVLDRVDGKLDGLIVASPSNPTGSMLDASALKALTGYCRERGIRLISDEIYHGITFGQKAETALSFDDQVIVINSFSKYFSMTGWRLGWMVVPEPLVRSVECLAQNMFISPPTLSQLAGSAVFDCIGELDANVAHYARNRKLLLAELPKAGFDKLAPSDGAFYLYADIAHMTNDSQDFCRRMLAETGVATTPGVDFDPQRGSHTLRFSFAGSAEDMAAAAERLKGWLA